MIPETNHDTEISIYYDFLEDQGIIVDRDPELQDQWHYEYKSFNVGFVFGVGGFGGGGGRIDVVGGGIYNQSTRVGG